MMDPFEFSMPYIDIKEEPSDKQLLYLCTGLENPHSSEEIFKHVPRYSWDAA